MMQFRCFILSVLLTGLIPYPNSFLKAVDKDKILYNKYGHKYLYEIFKNRRSVRNFKSDPIPRNHLLEIIDIARSAPTAGNQQPWKFLIIQDREKIEQLFIASVEHAVEKSIQKGISDKDELNHVKEKATKNYRGYLSAPVIIVVLTDSESKYPSYNEKDGALAAGYLIIAARSLGYGSVFTTDSFSENLVSDIFEIPKRFRQICLIPVGIPHEWPQIPDKKPLEEFIIFENFSDNQITNHEKETIEPDSDQLSQFVGEYNYRDQLSIIIHLKNGHLYMESVNGQKVRLSPQSENSFYINETEALITFIRDENGEVIEFVANESGIEYHAQKIN